MYVTGLTYSLKQTTVTVGCMGKSVLRQVYFDPYKNRWFCKFSDILLCINTNISCTVIIGHHILSLIINVPLACTEKMRRHYFSQLWPSWSMARIHHKINQNLRAQMVKTVTWRAIKRHVCNNYLPACTLHIHLTNQRVRTDQSKWELLSQYPLRNK